MPKQQITRLQLDTDVLLLFALVSGEKQHRLSWALNRQMAIGLQQAVALGAPVSTPPHIIYRYEQYHECRSYVLFPAKGVSKWLARPYRNIDYLFAIGGRLSAHERQSIIARLRGTHGILAAIPFETQHLAPQLRQMLA